MADLFSDVLVPLLIALPSLLISLYVLRSQNKLTRDVAVYQCRVDQFNLIREAVGDYINAIDPNVFVDAYVTANQGDVDTALGIISSQYDVVTKFNSRLELYLFEYRTKNNLVDGFMDDRAKVVELYSQSLTMTQMVLTLMQRPSEDGAYSCDKICKVLSEGEYFFPMEILKRLSKQKSVTFGELCSLLHDSINIRNSIMDSCYSEDGGIVKHAIFSSHRFIVAFHDIIDKEFRKGKIMKLYNTKDIDEKS